MKRLSPFLEVLRVTIAVLVSVVVIRYALMQPFVVEGSSMEPNYHNGEYLVVEKVSYRFHEPKRGDVVVLRYPYNPSISYIKRIIALPGEKLRIFDGQVSVNGQLLNEPYLAEGEETVTSRDSNVPYEVTLGSGEYFVMGDNRQHSSDSRDGWLLDRKNIIGRSAVVLYSNQNLRAIASPQ